MGTEVASRGGFQWVHESRIAKGDGPFGCGVEAAGHDRLAADLRPLMAQALLRRGLPRALACHPYDLAALLIAQEAGIHVTDARGGDLAYPLDTDTECTWIGYGGSVLRERTEPVFQAVLRERGLI